MIFPPETWRHAHGSYEWLHLLLHVREGGGIGLVKKIAAGSRSGANRKANQFAYPRARDLSRSEPFQFSGKALTLIAR